jgi:hypothetical protein
MSYSSDQELPEEIMTALEDMSSELLDISELMLLVAAKAPELEGVTTEVSVSSVH